MRQRLEDLGRIAVYIDKILELDIWEVKDNVACRNKDFEDYFYKLDEERQRDILSSFVYGLEEIKEKIYNCREIAYGEDPYNEPAQ